jgi:hypothetical protein
MRPALLAKLRYRGAVVTRASSDGVTILVPSLGLLELSCIGDDERLLVVATEIVVKGESRQVQRARRRELVRIAHEIAGDDATTAYDPLGLAGAPTKGAAA